MSKNIESKSIDQLLAEAHELTRQMDSDEVFGMNVEHRLQFNIHTKNLEKSNSSFRAKKKGNQFRTRWNARGNPEYRKSYSWP